MRVGIIGGGASGALLALNLLRQGQDVVLYDPSGRPGRGLAYGVDHPAFLMNVPARGLSAFEALPGDFMTWLEQQGIAAAPGDFVPRLLYGRYLEDRLAEPAAGTLRVMARAVTVVDPAVEGVHLVDDRGGSETVQVGVLALGNAAPGMPIEGVSWRSPWDPTSYRNVRHEQHLLLLGTGLSCVDVVARAEAAGFRGRYTALSRHGLLPRAHQASTPAVPTDLGPPNLATWLQRFRRHPDPLAAIDAVRSRLPELWQSLSAWDQARFLRHVRPYWDVYRHRMPPFHAELLAELQAAGRLRVVAGRLQSGLQMIPRGGGPAVQLRCDGAYLCTGPGRPDQPLIQNLIRSGHARLDRWEMGLQAGSDGRLTGCSLPLYVLGPLRRGELWESTAIPEIRRQAALLATHLAAREEVVVR